MTNKTENIPLNSRQELVSAARQVLRNNIHDGFTRPAPSLYPHQWNWDAGFIALGYVRSDFQQACLELSTLFRGQWLNGMVPQIVFSNHPVCKYFPGYRFWQTKGVPAKPKNVRTSGITMPPVHGFVLQRLLSLAPDLKASRPFFRRMFDKIVHLHQYCYDFRDPAREGLAFICHPWESGMDNLPTWESVFAHIQIDPSEVPHYERVDLEYVHEDHRPRKLSYDRYIYLVNRLRENRYNEPEIWQHYPFQVQEPMFNAILNHSNEALIEIGQWLRRDTAQLKEWFGQTQRAINDKLWDEVRGIYVSYDRVQLQQVPILTAGGLLPLLCGAPNEDQADRMLQLLQSPVFAGTAENPAWLCASTALNEPQFDPCRYWRGPVWININWMLYQGLLRYGQTEQAERLRNESLELIRRFGFWEYYNPWKNLPAGEQHGGYGSNNFSWTAALMLDWIGE
ncbi:MAG: hypothetical protein IT261_04290 [Saprospiraceae bacterium]|nr:hypothetical protein [Saprospiraceae bacterium]